MAHDRILQGKVALVTGASSGLGAATARQLAAAGACVAVQGRDMAALQALADDLRADGHVVSTHAGDLACAGVPSAMVEAAIAAHGGLDILVNNAGVAHAGGIATGSARAGWANMLDVNVLAPAEASQAAIAHMRATGRDGHTVIVSSSVVRMQTGGMYGVSKAAAEYLAHHLRWELEGDAIRVTHVLPGAFPTKLGRNLAPEAVAKLVERFGAVDAAPDADGRTPLVGHPDDIGRAIVYAVTQPIYLNVFELRVQPAMETDAGLLN